MGEPRRSLGESHEAGTDSSKSIITLKITVLRLRTRNYDSKNRNCNRSSESGLHFNSGVCVNLQEQIKNNKCTFNVCLLERKELF